MISQIDANWMTFDQYQAAALASAVYLDRHVKEMFRGLEYTALGLAGEAGELANKVKKLVRGDAGATLSEERREALKSELAGVLWYVAAVADELEFSLAEIVNASLVTVQGRLQRGAIQGDGDTR
jgi:NTP pyrophosphatase (non-canonical NTP hydrolase)